MKKVRSIYFLFIACISVLFFSCEAAIETEETDSGELVLSLYANYDEQIAPALQHFSANTFFKLKKNPFTRAGYTFLGWTDSESSSFVMYDNRSDVAFRTDKNLYALWRLNTYRVSYQLNGGKRTVVYPEEFTILNGTSLNPAHNGKYTFGGWYENKKFTGSPITKIPAGTTGDKTVYARWCGEITYHLNDGQFSSDVTTACAIPVQEEGIAETDAEETSDFGALQEPDLPPLAADTDMDMADTVAVQTEASTETDTPDVLDDAQTDIGVSADEQTVYEVVLETDEQEAVAETAEDEDTFVIDDTSVTDEAVLAEIPAADEDTVAESEPADDIETFSDTVVCYYTVSTDVTLPVPVREDYDFCGWYYDESFENPADDVLHDFTAPSVALYAKWKKTFFSVTYYAEQNESSDVLATEKAEIDSEIMIAANDFALVRDGYALAGWYATVNEQAERFFIRAGAPYVVKTDVSLYPAWIFERYDAPRTVDTEMAESDAAEREEVQEPVPFTLVLDDTVVAVADGALKDCVALVSLTADTVSVIGAEAFRHTGLTSIALPAVTEIGAEAFAACDVLQTVILPQNVPTFTGKQIWKNCADGLRFVVPKAQVAAYKKALTPAVVGINAKSYTIVAQESK